MPLDFEYTDRFAERHIGPSKQEIEQMLEVVGASSLDELVDQTIPASIRLAQPLALPPALSEYKLLERASELAARNQRFRSFIGMGYHDTITPAAIQRGILENPGWYTQYTPYQAEISQGRLEALLNFQTMVSDLTGLEIANSSLLDEGTAAAEAMMMLNRMSRRDDANAFFVSELCHPQTIEVVMARARPIGVEVIVGDHRTFEFGERVFGALVQYPATDGGVFDYSDFCGRAHAVGAHVVVAADILSLALLKAPGEFGADIAVGSTQRFGVPLGYGGPHAAYFATREEFKRQVPGRIIGVTIDADGNRALRMALQTREQHIRRDRATSNICTAQVLLAVIAGMYAVYHGPEGIRRIATRVHDLTRLLAAGLKKMGYSLRYDDFFDTITVEQGTRDVADICEAAEANGVNLRYLDDGGIGVSLDETVDEVDLDTLLAVFDRGNDDIVEARDLGDELDSGYFGALGRTRSYLEHPVFNRYHSETELMRYMQTLASRDLSLTTSMIPLGSCTMKLNAAAELFTITMPGFSRIHPFVPSEQVKGYAEMMGELSSWLAEITGFAATSLQPNSGASGEYAGLRVIEAYHASRGQGHRRVCLIPDSAHGTNPASAVMVGMKVVAVRTDSNGNIDVEDLRAKAAKHAEDLAALMVTYPSTHGVFEQEIREICAIIHEHGGQVYMDGANMNAQVGLCRPGDFGADVCHLNLHKTFAIPHGGGGPGMGPICVAEHLVPFLPGHPVVRTGGEQAIGPVAAAPFGSANILLISWAYIRMLGAAGLTRASEVAILSANYMAKRLEHEFDVLYRGKNGRVAHEFIVDLRPFKRTTGIAEIDVAKRLMDYGFHAPTMSFPVAGTIMIEPTESEAKDELDRFCEALLSIREEIRAVAEGSADPSDNVLKNAPHTMAMVVTDDWAHAYGREQAAFPVDWTRVHKFWPSVRRVDDAYGDRNLICTCPSMEEYA
jgi:glycine dehydrogenase